MKKLFTVFVTKLPRKQYAYIVNMQGTKLA